MPMQSASSHRSLHLLRALLREASYLPDAVARSYFRRYIVSRFRAYQPRNNSTLKVAVQALERDKCRGFKSHKQAIIHERTRPLLKKAQKGLNFLRRANSGELPCLTKVLCFAYGRLGKRRYIMLANLLRPDSADCNESRLAPLQQIYHSKKRFLQYFTAPEVTRKNYHTFRISPRFGRLRAVIESQHARGISLNRPLKRPDLTIPIHNVWGRPMPIRRARNTLKKWYAETMTKLLPPVPLEWWDSLRAMKDGEKKASLVRRRTPARSVDGPPHNDEQRSFEIIQAGLVMDRPSRADKPAGMHRPHAITPRFMRRLYSRILTLCCKINYDKNGNQCKVFWGGTDKIYNLKQYTTPVDGSLFAGVDNSGLVPKSKSPKKPTDERDIMSRNTDSTLYARFPFFTEFLPDGHRLKNNLDEFKRDRAAIKANAGGQ